MRRVVGQRSRCEVASNCWSLDEPTNVAHAAVQKEAPATEVRVVVAGIAVTLAAALLVYCTRAVHSYRIKQL